MLPEGPERLIRIRLSYLWSGFARRICKERSSLKLEWYLPGGAAWQGRSDAHGGLSHASTKMKRERKALREVRIGRDEHISMIRSSVE